MKSYVFGGDHSKVTGEGTNRPYAGTQYEEAHIQLDDYERTVDSSDPDEENVEILRDGDSVPAWGESSPHQDDLQDPLQDRIDESGNLNLSDSEFVAVYELNEPPRAATSTTWSPSSNPIRVRLTRRPTRATPSSAGTERRIRNRDFRHRRYSSE